MLAIEVKNLTFTYSKKTPYEKKALDNVNFEIREGEFFGIVGATGSGKSTLVSHFNALQKIQEGEVNVFGISTAEKKTFRELRGLVGMVFQYPEYQLFEETVARDVAFGPKNMKLSGEEIEVRVKEAIEAVSLDYEDLKNRSPFDLSGGQKRRVAIAGILAMRPKILVLDEPTAGLDPAGRKEILALVKNLQKTMCPTIVMISHNMDEISELADRILMLNDGKVQAVLPPNELFANKTLISESGLDFPTATIIQNKLKEKGFKFPSCAVTLEQLSKQILNLGGSSHVS
ncbi:MAG: energy-coupling factor transporter ATPase [Clostridia bacterium]|nr:energy-coupling factor transporter ATPase [Clostridia bacterium]